MICAFMTASIPRAGEIFSIFASSGPVVFRFILKPLSIFVWQDRYSVLALLEFSLQTHEADK
jgi:hypothetical protein